VQVAVAVDQLTSPILLQLLVIMVAVAVVQVALLLLMLVLLAHKVQSLSSILHW